MIDLKFYFWWKCFFFLLKSCLKLELNYFHEKERKRKEASVPTKMGNIDDFYGLF